MQTTTPAARFLVAALVLTACGGSPDGPPADLSPFPADAIHLRIGPVTIPPATEKTLCVTAYLPTTVPIDVVQIDTRQTYTHHVIFYRESLDTIAEPDLFDCPPLDILSASRAPLFIGETPDESMKLPPGVAYHLMPGAPYRIEGHFLNAALTDIQADAEIILTPARPGSDTQQADMIFLSAVNQLDKKYDGAEKGLPPMTQTTIDLAWWGMPDDMLGSKFYALTSHQHRLGSNFVITKSTAPSDPGVQLFQNSNWSHPPLLRYPDAEPLTFKQGEGFRWVCSYDNTTTDYIRFGQSALKNEMCILWAYYYPSQGFRVIFL